jgi:hypothetical protein
MPFLGLFAGLALKYPGAAKFVARFWKLGLGIALAVGAYFAFAHWLHNRDDAHFKSGGAAAEQQYTAKVNAANAIAAADQKAMNLMVSHFGFLAQNREQDIHVSLQPQIERITREIESNPVYRQCLVTDGVFDATNANAAAVNTRLGAGASRAAQ